jgi:acyl-coenzyme A thioesterase PaaI-like protein
VSDGTSREELQRLLDACPFNMEYEFEVEHAQTPGVRMRVPFRERYVRPGGVIPGFVFTAAADVAMWLAVHTVLGVSAEMASRPRCAACFSPA